MPICQITVSLPKEKVPADFSKQVAEVLARCLRKPIHYVVVHVATDQHIFSGSASNATTPTGLATLSSIGSVGLEDNRKTIAEVTKLVNAKLGISADEFRMVFVDLRADMVGCSGKLYADQF